MSIQKKDVGDLFLSNEVVIDVPEYNSGDGIVVDNTENKISADYDAIAAKLSSLPDPFPLSSQVTSKVSAESERAKAAEKALSDAIDSKIYIDGISAESLSAIHVDAETYYQKVLDGTVKTLDVAHSKASTDDSSDIYVVGKDNHEHIYKYVIECLLASNDSELKSRFRAWLGV